MKIDLHIGKSFESFINWLTDNFSAFFEAISSGVKSLIDLLESGLGAPHPVLMIIILALIAWYANGLKKWGFPLFTVIGFFIIYSMGLWEYLIQTMALVFVATFIALIIGVPLGILSGRKKRAHAIIRPCLDFMQTMPAFVYLIPAVLFFQLGKVPGVMATVIFAMPPAVRLTSLGLLQVPDEVMEASVSYGSTTAQQLIKVQLPVALPSILAGINQTIMLALSMVVIAAMIGAGGLGNQVLKGITQLKIGLGFESGVAIVILAIYLDRVTQGIGKRISRV
jgi:glycine betaine/proline transport system permease protein